MTDRSDVDHLEDILEAAEKARRFTKGMTYEALPKTRRRPLPSFVRWKSLARLQSEYRMRCARRYPSVPWRSMAGMRDKLIHDYVNVDLRIVWKTVQEEVPEAHRDVQRILRSLEE